MTRRSQHSESPDIRVTLITGLKPVIRPDCRVLICGSFPSVLSLETGQYYANPRNDFWRIMERVLEIPPGLSYQDRIVFLMKHGIGLWDAIISCQRTGSSDSLISRAIYADMEQLLFKFPDIHYILCNGRTAETGVLKALARTPGITERTRIVYLPSSSPAHAVAFERKCISWMMIRQIMTEQSNRE